MVRISLYIYLLFSTFSIIVFFLPLYLQHQGLNSAQIGTVIAFGSFVSMFAQLFWGYVSDLRKTVKGVLIVVLIGGLLLSFGVFSASQYALILLFYVGYMFFNSAVIPLTETLNISYAHEHNKDYGRLRVWGEIGIGTSALLFGLIIERIGLEQLRWLYAIIMMMALGAVFLVKDSKSSPQPMNIAAMGRLFMTPKLLWFLFVLLLVAIPHRMNDSMLSLYLEDLGATESQLGTAWLVATLSTIPAMIFAGRMIRRTGELGLFVIGSFVYVIRWALYSLADSPGMLIGLQAMHSLTFPLFLVASIQYLATIVPSHLRASGQAAFAVVFGGLGSIIGSAGGGAVIDALGAHTAYGIGCGFALAGTLAAIGTIMYNRKNAKLSTSTDKQVQVNT